MDWPETLGTLTTCGGLYVWKRVIVIEVDQRALQILLDAEGFAPDCSRKDFEYAKLAGMMFDDEFLSHDDIANQILNSIQTIDRRSVADAFVASLSTQRLDLRSAMGSYAVLQHFPSHVPNVPSGNCNVCGRWIGPGQLHDLNRLNYERFKWGGVRHDDPIYANFDLQLFRRLPPVNPSGLDVKLLANILMELENLPDNTTAVAAARQLAGVLRSNKSEREVLIEIFGYCGILETAERPGFRNRFIPWSDREQNRGDMDYPACWWRRSDGINEAAIDYWFGHLL